MDASGHFTYDDKSYSVKADRAELNMTAKTGRLFDAEVFFKEKNYHLKGKEIEKLRLEISRCEQKMQNPNFVDRAPADVVEKVRQKYEQEFISQKDLYFFLGTTKKWHKMNPPNPFVIIGVFYPKKELQQSLF